MSNHVLFTDASLSPKLKVGIGGYILLSQTFVQTLTLQNEKTESIQKIDLEHILRMKKFKDTSSTRLEVQTVLWALEEYSGQLKKSNTGHLQIYSDSQCVAGLLSRRDWLEKHGFCSKGKKRPLKNASLYSAYYELHDRINFDVTKVPGHTRSYDRNPMQKIFAFLDQKIRKALKLWVSQLELTNSKWYVYIIRCHDDSLYTGISNDVAKRFEKHQKMGKECAKYLRGRGPLELVFQKELENKSMALKIEQEIKRLPKAQKESIIHTGDFKF